MFLYQVCRDGQVLMCTKHERCRYPSQIEAELMKAGYIVCLNGKKAEIVERAKDVRYTHIMRLLTARVLPASVCRSHDDNKAKLLAGQAALERNGQNDK